MLTHLLDTDTCIELLRGNLDVLARRERLPTDVATTWITAAELYFGAANSSNPEHNTDVVHAFLATLPLVGLDATAAQLFGEAKALLRRAGIAPPDADLLIAAIAIARDATVVTGNVAHFARIPGVRTEDWIRA